MDNGFSNLPLNLPQRQTLMDGLLGLGNWSNGLANHQQLNQALALLEQPIGSTLNPAHALLQGLHSPIVTYLTTNPTPTTDGLVATLRDLARTYGNLQVDVGQGSVTGGLVEPARNELLFTVGYQATRTVQMPIHLGARAAEQGFFLETQNVQVQTQLNFNFQFGMNLAAGLTPAQAFFIRTSTLAACAAVDVTGLNAGARIGILAAQVQNGSANLNACVNVGFQNPGPRGTITLSQMQSTPLADLVALTPSGIMSASLPVRATLGNWTVPGNPVIQVTTPNLFNGNPPDVALTGAPDLPNFTNITPHTLLSLFHHLGDRLDQFSDSSLFAGVEIPFAQNRTLSDVFDFASAYRNRMLRWLERVDGTTTWNTAQELVARLAEGLGLDPAQIGVNYNPATRDLTYNVRFSHTMQQAVVPINLSAGLGDFANIQSNATVTVNGGVNLQFAFGVNLTPLAPGESLDDKFFLQNATASGNVALAASNISASARLGFLQVQTTGGSASASANMNVALRNPGGVAGGRVTLSQILNALYSDVGSIVVGPTITGSAQLTLQQFSVAGNFFGQLPGNPRLTVNVPNFANLGSAQIAYADFDPLLPFRNLTFQDIGGSLASFRGYLSSLAGFSFLNTPLPLVGSSVSELLGYAQRFSTAIDRFLADPTDAIHNLARNLRLAFDLPGDSNQIRVTYGADRVLRIEVGLQASYSQTVPLNLDLVALGVSGLGGARHLISTTGNLAVQAGANLNVQMGIDLSNPARPVPFLFDSTGLSLTARANGTNLNFSAGLGPLGLFVRNGNATLDRDGNPATAEPAAFTVSLPQTADHRYPLANFSLNQFNVALQGAANITLPLYFPLDSIPLGGSPPANHLVVNIGSLSNIPGTITLRVPDFQPAFGSVNVLDRLGLVTDGLDRLLATIQSALSSRMLRNLPLVGRNLANTARFIEDFRTNVVQRLRGLGDYALQTVRQALFNVFGPAGLNLLKDLTSDNQITLDDVQLSITADQIQFNLRLGKDQLWTTGIGFDLGLPVLGLEVNAPVRVALGWDFFLGFGVHRNLGFYFDSSRAEEMSVNLNVTTPGLSAFGHLLFLRLGVRDNPDDPTRFTGQFSVNLKDPNNDGRLTFGELVNPGTSLAQLLDSRLTGDARANLRFVVDFNTDTFPSIHVDFAMRWGFNSSDPAGPAGTFGNRPEVTWSNARLDLGTFLTRFVRPILNRITNVLDPIMPVVNFMTARIPILSDLMGRTVSLVTLAQTFGRNVDLRFLNVVRDVYNFARSIPSAGNVMIDIGSFNLGSFDPRVQQLGTAAVNIIRNAVPAMQQMAVSAPATRTFVSYMNSTPGGGLQFPLLQNPMSVFGLLLGRDVDLFTFDLPTLRAGFSYSQFFPILGPIGVRLRGSLDVSAHAKFGYDTRGLRMYAQSRNFSDVFEGFYADRSQTYFRIVGEIAGSAEVNIIVASVGGGGYLRATVNFNLNDPDRDGKVRPREIANNFARHPLAIFDISGSLVAGLEVYARVNLLFYRRTWRRDLGRWTLLSWNINPGPAPATQFLITTPQNVVAGQNSTITVTAVDARGNRVPSYRGTVAFDTDDDLAGIPRTYTFRSGDNGQASFNVPFRSVGLHRISVAESFNPAMYGYRDVVVNPGPVTTFDISSIPTGMTAGNQFVLTVIPRDAFGNAVPAYRGTVRFESDDVQAALPVNYTFTAADNGIRTFPVTLKTAGTKTLRIIDAANANARAIRSDIFVMPGSATRFSLDNLPGTLNAGTTTTVTVTARDAYGNVAPSYRGEVRFTSSDPRATLPANYTFTAADRGQRNVSIRLLASGSQRVSIADVRNSGVVGNPNVTVLPGAAVTFLMTGFQASVTAGTLVSATLTARDTFGNIATGYRGVATLTSDDPQATLPGSVTFLPNDNGARPVNVTLRTAGARRITARDSVQGAILGTLSGITITPAAMSSFRLSNFRPTITAGEREIYTFTATDSFGNTVPTYQGTVRFTSDDGLATLPPDYTFRAADLGRTTVGITLRTAGSRTITMTDLVNAAFRGTTGGIQIAAAVANGFTVSGFPAAATAGVAANFTLTARDLYGNAAPTYRGTVRFSSDDAQAQLPVNYTFTAADNGVKVLSATLSTVGTRRLTATDTVALFNGNQHNISVQPAATSAFTLSDLPPSSRAGEAVPFTVTARDAFGNTATGYRGTVRFSATDGQAALPAEYTFTEEDNGVVLIPDLVLYKAGLETVTVADSVNANARGSGSLTVTPADAAYFALFGPSEAAAGTPFDLTAVVYDAYDNLVYDYTGTLTFLSSDEYAALPADYTFTLEDGGMATFPGVVLYQEGDHEIAAYDLDTGTVYGQMFLFVLPEGGSAPGGGSGSGWTPRETEQVPLLVSDSNPPTPLPRAEAVELLQRRTTEPLLLAIATRHVDAVETLFSTFTGDDLDVIL